MNENQQLEVDRRVAVYPFTRQAKGDEVVIGRLDTRTFLALPPDAVEVLDDLADGKTIREASDLHRDRHGEVPDMESFLGVLGQKGFLRTLGDGEEMPEPSAAEWESTAGSGGRTAAKRHFTGISQSWARRLSGRGALITIFGIIALAALAVFLDPSVIPGRSALYFSRNQTVNVLIVMLWGYSTLFLHELAHLIAARALGLDASMGVSHRMYVLVAETDLTGLWSVPKTKRYLPLLAGTLLDLVSAAVFVLLTFAHHRGWIDLPAMVLHISRAIIVTYFLRILWQCFFFLRTDYYYLIVTAFDCANLMRNTEDYLRRLCARWLPFYSTRRELSVSPAELRVVRAYAPLWVLGRLAALASLAFVALPVMWRYTVSLGSTLARGYGADPGAFIDAMLLLVLAAVPFFAGLVMWIQSLLRVRRTAI